jgi:CPA2 family monovalent cation:H+ antiporter-2
MHGWELIFDLLVALSAALILGLICERFKINAIVGYLLAGAIAGPGALKLLQKPDEVAIIAEIGVALLLFTIGLEFSFRSLRQMGSKILFGGVLAIASCTLILTACVIATGQPWQAALILGAAGSLSSTAIVMRVLRQRNELDTNHGKAALGVLLVQDLAVVFLVLVVTFLGSNNRNIGLEITRSLGATALLVVALVVFSSKIVPRLLHEKVVARNRELPIILAVVTCVGAAWSAHTLKLSPALGAFLAGMLLAENKFSEQMRADVLPLRTLFVTLFFVSVGLLADLSWIATNLLLVLAASLIVIAVKTVATYFSLRPFLRGIIECLAVAIALSQIGEFSFVLITIGAEQNLINPDLFQLAISTTLFTLLAAPFLVRSCLKVAKLLARRIVPARKLAKSARESKSKALTGHIVILGFGEAGQATAEGVESIDCPKLVVDLDPNLVLLAEQTGVQAIIGDATNSEFLLEVAHIARAKAILITMSDHLLCRRSAAVCKAVAPQTPVIVRSRYHVYALELDMVGADVVVDEEWLVGINIGRETKKLLNIEQSPETKWAPHVPEA